MRGDRLLQLAQHLRSNNRKCTRFDFAQFYKQTRCGTCGCALGECPTVWPKEWYLRAVGSDGDFRPNLKDEPSTSATESAEKFFDLWYSEVQMLFFPNADINWLEEMEEIGLAGLDTDATPEQVAANIERFVEWKENQ